MDRPFGKNPRPGVLVRNLRAYEIGVTFHKMPTPTTYKLRIDSGDMGDLVRVVEGWGMIARPRGPKIVIVEDPDE